MAAGTPVPLDVGRVDDVKLAAPEIVGASIVGDVANTAAPVPVSSVSAASRFALDGVAKNVPTPVPSPVTLPISGVIVVALAAVTNPFALTVIAVDCVALPKLPTLPLTVARVKAVAPVASPVWVAFETSPEYCELVALSPVLLPESVVIPSSDLIFAAVKSDADRNNPTAQSYTDLTDGYFVLLA